MRSLTVDCGAVVQNIGPAQLQAYVADQFVCNGGAAFRADIRIEECSYTYIEALKNAADALADALADGYSEELPALAAPRLFGMTDENPANCNFRFTLETKFGEWIYCTYRAFEGRLYLSIAECGEKLAISVKACALLNRAFEELKGE